MSRIILPSKRLVQPTGPVEIDWSRFRPVTAFIASAPRFDLATKNPYTIVGTPSFAPGRNGVAEFSTSYTAGNWLQVRTGNPATDNWPGVTVVAQLHAVAIGQQAFPSVSIYAPYGQVYGGWNISIEETLGPKYNLYFLAGDSASSLSVSGVYYDIPSTSEYQPGNLINLCCVFDRVAGKIKIHSVINGVKRSVSANHTTSWRNASSIENIGGYFGYSNRASPHKLYGVTVLPYAVDDDLGRSLANNPWQIFKPVTRRIYFDVGGSSPTDNLTATGIAAGNPNLSTPIIGQTHALGGSNITTGSPSLSVASIWQIHSFDATGITTGVPNLSTPSLSSYSNVNTLTATDIAAGAPNLSAPTVGQVHGLTASGIAAGAPNLSMPSIGQEHALGASGIAAGVPNLSSAIIGQTHGLGAIGIAAGTPILSFPTLSAYSNIDSLTASDIGAGAPNLSTPGIGQAHVLSGYGIAAGNPSLSLPGIGQVHGLNATGVTAGAPNLSAPSLIAVASVDPLAATDIATGTPSLSSPSIGQAHVLAAVTIAAGAPNLGNPAIGQINVLSGSDIFAGAPVLSSPSIGAPGVMTLTQDDLAAIDALIMARLSDIATAVLSAAQVTPIHADVKAGQSSIADAVWSKTLP